MSPLFRRNGRDGQVATNSEDKKNTDTKTMSDTDLRKKLTPEQYHVTRENGTEPPFRNEYWNNHKQGIYVDLISGEALFASTDKFESGTGWPSFTKPIDKSQIVEKTDRSLFMSRTEVRSKEGRRPSRARFRRRPGSDGTALLPELGLAPVRAEGENAGGRLRRLFVPLRRADKN